MNSFYTLRKTKKDGTPKYGGGFGLDEFPPSSAFFFKFPSNFPVASWRIIPVRKWLIEFDAHD